MGEDEVRYEQMLCDGDIIARFDDEGLRVDWYNTDGTRDRTLAVVWADLYDQAICWP